MFSTTLRLPDELAAFLQEAARSQGLSVNAYLARLVEERREGDRRSRLARDWALYAGETAAQDVEYAFDPQVSLAAETPLPYRAKHEVKKPRKRT
ncbi:hypothetical protein [Geothrix sp. 21YS21S-2]|uniref:hypothetical protein n=1 Tax=Geothrix sp. 21YS21S-2 TaxID=3068893 RepID=UPI0027BAE322|nr:hypothetical protein [Geothrix sp. 21YS21S-2]